MNQIYVGNNTGSKFYTGTKSVIGAEDFCFLRKK